MIYQSECKCLDNLNIFDLPFVKVYAILIIEIKLYTELCLCTYHYHKRLGYDLFFVFVYFLIKLDIKEGRHRL